MIDDILPHLFSRMRLSICQRLQRRQHTFFISRNHSIRFLWGETVLSYSIPSSGSVCNSVANAKKFFVGLATVLQTPESFSWDLQQCCKRRKVFRGICSIPANAKKFFEAFAAFLQTPKSFSGHLQHSCKDQKVSRGICSVAAKHFQKLCAAFRALSKTFFRDKDPYSFAELAFGMCFVQIFCIVRSMYAHCEGVQIDIPSIFAPNKRDFT